MLVTSNKIAQEVQNRIKRHLFPTLVVIIVAFLGLGAFFVVPDVKHIFATATNKQYDHYTELYFENPEQLPITLSSSTPTDIPFVITNHESTDTTYTYRVTMTENGKTHEVRTQTITLYDSQSSRHVVRVKADKPNAHIIISVELLDRPQQIQLRSRS